MFREQVESDFLELVCRYLDNDPLTPAEWAGLNEQLRQDPARRETFVRLCLQAKLIAEALPMEAPAPPPVAEWPEGIVITTDDPSAEATVSGARGGAVSGAIGYLSQLTPFSYLVATVLFGLGLLVGSFITVSHSVPHDRIVHRDPTIGPSPIKGPPIGRITATMDCQWTDPRDRLQGGVPATGANVSLGRTYSLASGFLEITYDRGAKVILEGPAIYRVESASGGFLSFGKLTARVAARAPLSALPFPLFTVRTPTAVVTDLGTEFGVEVEKSGATKSRVFLGKVEVRPAGGRPGVGPVVLTANQWLSVDAGRTPVVSVVRGAPSGAPLFVRHIPRRVPIQVFATGAGLMTGQADPHWRIVAHSGYSHRVPDGPAFQPQAAVVTVPADTYAADDSARAQWISTAGNLPNLPLGYYTFRTTFNLADAPPAAAVLRGRFMVDNHLEAIRLNGQPVPVPEHEHLPPFTQFHAFTITKGFVRGTNVLEIEVFNYPATKPGDPRAPSPMALLVDLKGYTTDGSADSAANAGGNEAQTGGRSP
jgi:hypothetical protein